MDFRPMNDRPTPVHPAPAPVPHPTQSQPKHQGQDPKKKPRGKMLLWLIVLVILAAAVGTAAYYVNRYHDSQAQVKKLASNPTITAQQQQQQLIDKIGKITVLPSGEAPTLATVTDVTKLKDQPFFANAQNGDKVLIYTQAKQAFLYRPSTNKLINIAPVNLGSGQPQATGTQTQPVAPAKR
jgi:hypothetical protein